MGVVEDWKKRCWMGLDVVQHGVMSLCCALRVVNAERRCVD